MHEDVPAAQPPQGQGPAQSQALAVSLAAVGLFPLPNVVLFPRAVLPLHIFEERYKAMTADALAGDRQIAMALLKPGWEKSYYFRPAVEPIVCVGKILTHERLPDGRYNFLLQGTVRARLVKELSIDVPYRVAQLQALPEEKVFEIDLGPARERLAEIFSQKFFATNAVGKQFRQMLTSPLSTADIADLIAFNVLDDVSLKQALLSETDVRKRVDRVIQALDGMRPLMATVGAERAGLN
jgi:Lon protease-like protein